GTARMVRSQRAPNTPGGAASPSALQVVFLGQDWSTWSNALLPSAPRRGRRRWSTLRPGGPARRRKPVATEGGITAARSFNETMNFPGPGRRAVAAFLAIAALAGLVQVAAAPREAEAQTNPCSWNPP